VSLRKWIVSRPSACRAPTESPVPVTATCLVARMAGAFVLFGLLTSSGASAADSSAGPDERSARPASAVLTTSVSETPDVVRLCIRALGDVEPGSVEIRFMGRKAIVRARNADGRAIRLSQPFRLPARVVEEPSSADYDADGALVMTFRKQAIARDARRTGDPEVVRPSRLAAPAEPRGAIPR